MILQDGKTVRTGDGILVWDGLHKPEQRDGGKLRYSVSLAFPVGDLTLQELEQVAQAELQSGIHRGTMPPGGDWPTENRVDPAKIPELPNHVKVSFATGVGIPPIYDANGNQLDFMQTANMLYAGTVCQVLGSPWSYPAAGKVKGGIAFNLNGLMIVNPQAPRLSVASGMSAADVAAGFGFGSGAGGPAPAAAPSHAAQAAPTGAAPAPGPAPGFTGGPAAPAPAGPQMTPQAQYSYEQYRQAGWTDEQLRANGLMV